ncbi:Transcriptional adapter 3 [Bagarius yarrelli]|uniref:Abasic site processing protein HMCES n=1 Tax=Bagarius yarrelli TaxID=175774 RepID=A0A556V9E4_BAGYA|nr:Transcriptional adapter 3 [Bagarius yarrelli]
MSELKDCPPLKYYDFKPVEHVKLCPRYTAVLGRSEDDGIGIEELDTLQLELETLLSSASRRLRALEEQRQILTDWQDKKGDKRFLKIGKEVDPAASSRHPKPKKPKLEGKAGHGPSPGPGRPKSKNLQPKVQEYEFSEDPQDIPRNPKNDTPNRFWASVEPYCADITNEEIRVLEDLLKPPEDEAEYYKIPALGKHYSQRWAQEDLLEEQREGARVSDKKKSMLGPLSEIDAKDVDALLKKSESQHEPPEDGCPFGPLTQRLLQALVEENIISPMEDSPIPDIPVKDDGAGTSPRSQGKAFSVPHTRSLEARIREELVAQGLFDSDERQGVGGESEDEVLAELQKRQAELKALSAHNRARKQELLRLAREEMRKQELRQCVRVADNEVMEAFRRIMAARQKKRTPTKKEKDQAWKALKERERILKQLDAKVRYSASQSNNTLINRFGFCDTSPLMCGRTACTLAPDEVRRASSYRDRSGKKRQPQWRGGDADKYRPSYNKSPQSFSPVLLLVRVGQEAAVDECVLATMRWGLVPAWFRESDPSKMQYSTSNCRSESLLEKKSYKDPLLKGQRCVILADGFYEWRRQQKDKQPFFIYFPQSQREEQDEMRKDGQSGEGVIKGDAEDGGDWTGWRLLTIAGLFDCWTPPGGGEVLYTYTVITVNASPNLQNIHDRMPAVLDGDEEVRRWLDFGEVRSLDALRLLQSKSCLTFHPVSSIVNNSRNNSPECLQPLDPKVASKSPSKVSASSRMMINWLKNSPGKRKTPDDSEPKKPEENPAAANHSSRGTGLMQQWLMGNGASKKPRTSNI